MQLDTLFGLTVRSEFTPEGPQEYEAQFTDENLRHLPAVPISDTIRKAWKAPRKLDPAIKTEWLTALRSGDWKQVDGFLAREMPSGWRYCCLGVLCELQHVPSIEVRESDALCREYQFKDADGAEEKHSRAWLEGTFSEMIPKDLQQALGELNDSGSWDFTLIADLIEAVF